MINGKIWTADSSNPYAEAVAIVADKIIAVGTTDEIETYITEHTKIIDLKKKRVVPGFQDSHTHFIDEAIKTTPLKDPYTPKFKAYNRLAFEFGSFFTGLLHIGVKMLGSTPMDLLPPQQLPNESTSELRLKRGIHELHKMGITTVFELGTDWEHYQFLLSLQDKNELDIRCELYFASRLIDKLIQTGINRHTGDEWVRVLGVKFYSDGWLGPRTCALRESYQDKTFIWQKCPGYTGILYMDQNKANRDILKARLAGLKIATHTIGDRAVEVILNAYENALSLYPDSDHRYTLEHASVLGPDLIERIKMLHVIPSIQFSFATTDMYFVENALGSERTKYTYPWQTLLDNDIICTGGSDFPVEVISPLWGIQRMVTRQDVNAFPEDGWHPEERISVEDALRMITINSAYSSFEEDTKGSIETGKFADIVVLSRDILDIPPTEIAATEVVLTMVGGKIVYERADQV